ncbi:MAG: YceI family protein [Chitinophagales bacterium]
MNKFLQFFVALVLTIGMVSCQSAPDAPKADTQEAKDTTTPTKAGEELMIDLEQSSVTFIGTKPTGQHTGVVKISKGSSLTINNGEITGGKFEMDLTSFKITDLEGENGEKLTNHLKSNDFFDVVNHPTATFEVTGVKPYAGEEGNEASGATHMISGNLTLKGVTKNIAFPASLGVDRGMARGRANFNIDRTEWGLAYGNDKSLGDRFINPQVNIQLMIMTEK